jgi:signal peptidase I
LKSQEFEPAPFVKYDKEGTVSMPVVIGLLQAMLDKGKPFRFEATGGSMSPFVRDGDVITVSPLSDTPPRLGDVVVFIRPESGKLVVHRVVGKRDGSYLIRGDNAPDSADLVPRANVLGRVTRVERGGKRVHLGLGPERYLIAFLTRRELLWPLLLPVWRLVRPVVRLLGFLPEGERAPVE